MPSCLTADFSCVFTGCDHSALQPHPLPEEPHPVCVYEGHEDARCCGAVSGTLPNSVPTEAAHAPSATVFL